MPAPASSRPPLALRCAALRCSAPSHLPCLLQAKFIAADPLPLYAQFYAVCPQEVCSSSERLCYNCKQPGHESNTCPHPRTTEGKQCYHCQGLGHVQADCPTLRLSGAGTSGRCYSCGQPGHLARACPNPAGMRPGMPRGGYGGFRGGFGGGRPATCYNATPVASSATSRATALLPMAALLAPLARPATAAVRPATSLENALRPRSTATTVSLLPSRPRSSPLRPRLLSPRQ
ncbi:hypothetical protein IWX49DRAFT_356783 [Phyllosticta citricarpa]